jgi:hypothetical protein
MAFILGSPPGVNTGAPYSAFQQSPIGPDTPEPNTSAGAILVEGMGAEGEPPGLFYAGLAGTEWVQFYTDSCPCCGHTHVTYAPPVLNANGQLQLSFPCFNGPPGSWGQNVTFVFAGYKVPASGDVLNALATGQVVGN